MKICGHTYVTEGVPNPDLGYDESPLLRCGQCKHQWYKSKESQKAHWKAHKLFCRPVSERQLPNDLDQLFKLLEHQILSGGATELPFVLCKIRQVMDSGAKDHHDMAFKMHTFARGILFHPTNVIARVMAAPQMVQLMLSSERTVSSDLYEDLLSDKARVLKQLQQLNVKGRPTPEYMQYNVTDENEKKQIEALREKYDEFRSSWDQPTSMSYCYLYFNLIVAAAIQAKQSFSSIHDGNGTIRGTISAGGQPNADYMLAMGAVRRAMELWSDPLVLESCGDAMAPAASLALTVISHFQERGRGVLGQYCCRPYELIPGLSVDGAVRTGLKELLQHAGSAQYSVKLIKLLAELSLKPVSYWGEREQESQTQPFWKDLPVERRASVALALVNFINDYDSDTSMGLGGTNDPPPFQECGVLFKTVCGMSNTLGGSNTDLVKQVFETAAENGEILGPENSGNNATERALFFWLLKSQKYNIETFQVEVKKFADLPSKEQDEYLKLARGERAHADIEERMERYSAALESL
jgi:hypothetical protein